MSAVAVPQRVARNPRVGVWSFVRHHVLTLYSLVFFAYLLLPEILFYGLGAMIGAILNTRGIFGPPAWAPWRPVRACGLQCDLVLRDDTLEPGNGSLKASNVFEQALAGQHKEIIAELRVLEVDLK